VGGEGQGGEMTQTMYAHINKQTNKQTNKAAVDIHVKALMKTY
jgi:hypothetical protein